VNPSSSITETGESESIGLDESDVMQPARASVSMHMTPATMMNPPVVVRFIIVPLFSLLRDQLFSVMQSRVVSCSTGSVMDSGDGRDDPPVFFLPTVTILVQIVHAFCNAHALGVISRSQ
jgi:hypothetical protein